MAGFLMSARAKRLRYVVIGIAVSIGASSALSQVSSDVKLSFDVAAIKPTGPDQRQRLSIEPGGRFVADGFSVKTLIAIAYGLTTSFQMVGGGGWEETDRWSIQAKADGVTSIPNWSPPYIPEIIAVRLRSLLEDRFLLKSHRESRIQQSYALVESKTGSKLVRTEAPSPSTAESGNPVGNQPAQHPGSIKAGSGVVIGASTSVDQLVAYLNRLLDRPVINRTGITGYFNFKLQFAPESAPRYHSPPPSASGPGSEVQLSNDPPIFTAIQEQLGLKLESTKVPADVLVIDSVQKPSAN